MVLFKIYFLATILFVSEAYSDLTGAPRSCGPTTITPTGPIIPVGQFIVPAIIKPLITQCQPLPACQPLSPCLPLPPSQPAPPCLLALPSPPAQPCTPEKSVPFFEADDDDDTLDKILYLLINNILENKKNSGKKPGTRGVDSDKSADLSNNYVDCEDDCEYILPSPFVAYPVPASFCPRGVAGDRAPAGARDAAYTIPVSGNGYAPEICLTFKPLSDTC